MLGTRTHPRHPEAAQAAPCLLPSCAQLWGAECVRGARPRAKAWLCTGNHTCTHVCCLWWGAQVARQQALSTELLEEQQQLRAQCAVLRRQADDASQEQQAAQAEVAHARKALQQVCHGQGGDE